MEACGERDAKDDEDDDEEDGDGLTAPDVRAFLLRPVSVGVGRVGSRADGAVNHCEGVGVIGRQFGTGLG